MKEPVYERAKHTEMTAILKMFSKNQICLFIFTFFMLITMLYLTCSIGNIYLKYSSALLQHVLLFNSTVEFSNPIDQKVLTNFLQQRSSDTSSVCNSTDMCKSVATGGY